MKSFVAAILVVVGSLGMVNGVEAGRHWHVHYSWQAHRGVYRAHWAHRTWHRVYRRWVYTDPAVTGTYYYSAANKLYYPVDMLPASETVIVVK